MVPYKLAGGADSRTQTDGHNTGMEGRKFPRVFQGPVAPDDEQRSYRRFQAVKSSSIARTSNFLDVAYEGEHPVGIRQDLRWMHHLRISASEDACSRKNSTDSTLRKREFWDALKPYEKRVCFEENGGERAGGMNFGVGDETNVVCERGAVRCEGEEGLTLGLSEDKQMPRRRNRVTGTLRRIWKWGIVPRVGKCFGVLPEFGR